MTDLPPDEAAQQELHARLTALMDAAGDVIDNLGTPGASVRVNTLRESLTALTTHDPVSAVTVAAALWLDRYGSAGAPVRLMDLQDAVDALAAQDKVEAGLEVLFAAAERPFDNPAT